MAVRDILLQMSSYPGITPHWAIDAAAWFAEKFDARISAGLCQVHVPDMSNWLANRLVRANEAIAAENRKSREQTGQLLKDFAARIPEARRGDQILIECTSLITPRDLSHWARTRDLTLVPVDADLDWRYVAEGLIFESGRPVLLLPRAGGAGHRIRSGTIGWDGSRAAARALADSLPLLAHAETVQVVAVAGDKKLHPAAALPEAQRHLAAQGIAADVKTIDADARDAGAALCDEALAAGADLLVMGAYGHPRALEFVLGGATQSVLDRVPLPLLLSH